MPLPLSMNRVTIRDPYLTNAFDRERTYLLSLDPDRLLAGFRDTAGLPRRGEYYPGWENTEIRGHTLGHYLKALAQAYAATGGGEFGERIEYLVGELALCQREDGYLFAYRESLFANVEEQKPAWVPWYTMHKILSGLTACREFAGSPTALRLASRLGDWIYARTAAWPEEIRRRVLAVEYGGMNDGLYDLYGLTGKENHLKAARAFDELSLWEPLRRGEDILRGKHANTTIPKILGALNRYSRTGDGEALETAVRFWEMVVCHHSYVTGGNSEWEHFGEPDHLDGDRSRFTCETCNTYNMLRLSRGLFMVTGERRYADFYEGTLINAILSSQNPDTGMTMYFQPMAAGFFKVYSSPFDHFWCCTGTGMESFTKLNDSLYFKEGDRLYVNLFFSSRVDWEERGLILTQEGDIPRSDRVRFLVECPVPQKEPSRICLRLPPWAASPSLTLNGEPVPLGEEGGYAVLSRIWQEGDRIEYRLPCAVAAHTLPDNGRAAAFTYGPVVLSAGLGREDLSISRTGVMVDVPTKEMIIPDFLTLREGTPEEWLASTEKNLIRTGEDLTFRLRGTEEDESLVFTPHYRQHRERYGLYWNIVRTDSPEREAHLKELREAALLAEATLDSLPVGHDQYELTHAVAGEKTYTGTWDGYTYRCADRGGWFRYALDILPGRDNILMVTYFDFDRDRSLIIDVEGEMAIREECDFPPGRGFHDRRYTIPAALAEGRDRVAITFRGGDGGKSPGIYHILRMLKA